MAQRNIQIMVTEKLHLSMDQANLKHETAPLDVWLMLSNISDLSVTVLKSLDYKWLKLREVTELQSYDLPCHIPKGAHQLRPWTPVFGHLRPSMWNIRIGPASSSP